MRLNEGTEYPRPTRALFRERDRRNLKVGRSRIGVRRNGLKGRPAREGAAGRRVLPSVPFCSGTGELWWRRCRCGFLDDKNQATALDHQTTLVPSQGPGHARCFGSTKEICNPPSQSACTPRPCGVRPQFLFFHFPSPRAAWRPLATHSPIFSFAPRTTRDPPLKVKDGYLPPRCSQAGGAHGIRLRPRLLTSSSLSQGLPLAPPRYDDFNSCLVHAWPFIKNRSPAANIFFGPDRALARRCHRAPYDISVSRRTDWTFD